MVDIGTMGDDGAFTPRLLRDLGRALDDLAGELEDLAGELDDGGGSADGGNTIAVDDCGSAVDDGGSAVAVAELPAAAISRIAHCLSGLGPTDLAVLDAGGHSPPMPPEPIRYGELSRLIYNLAIFEGVCRAFHDVAQRHWRVLVRKYFGLAGTKHDVVLRLQTFDMATCLISKVVFHEALPTAQLTADEWLSIMSGLPWWVNIRYIQQESGAILDPVAPIWQSFEGKPQLICLPPPSPLLSDQSTFSAPPAHYFFGAYSLHSWEVFDNAPLTFIGRLIGTAANFSYAIFGFSVTPHGFTIELYTRLASHPVGSPHADATNDIVSHVQFILEAPAQSISVIDQHTMSHLDLVPMQGTAPETMQGGGAAAMPPEDPG